MTPFRRCHLKASKQAKSEQLKSASQTRTRTSRRGTSKQETLTCQPGKHLIVARGSASDEKAGQHNVRYRVDERRSFSVREPEGVAGEEDGRPIGASVGPRGYQGERVVLLSVGPKLEGTETKVWVSMLFLPRVSRMSHSPSTREIARPARRRSCSLSPGSDSCRTAPATGRSSSGPRS